MFCFQILAYVSQVHMVVLPEGVVDHDSLTLDQVREGVSEEHLFRDSV